MSRETKSKEQFLKEIDGLERRLDETEETLRAIRNGEVDAIYVERPKGDQIFTLKGADQTYRTLIEDMNEGAITTTLDGTILYANKAVSEMIQVPHELIVGASIDQYIAPENKPMFEALFQRGVQGGAEGEIALNNEKGSPVPVYISINLVLLEGEQVLCITSTDLTEQKRQEEIVKSERLSNAILEAAGEAILVSDNVGRIIRANDSVKKIVENSVLLKSFDDVFQLEILPKNNSETAAPFSLSQVLKGDSFHGREILFRKQNEEDLYFLLSATHLRSEENIIGCVLVLTDVTERKQLEMQLKNEIEVRRQAEEALQEAQDQQIRSEKLTALGKLAGTLGHEIKAPLSVIKHSFEFLKIRLDQGADVKIGNHLNIVHEKLDTIDKTIDDVLDFARTKKLELMTVDPGNLVEYLLRDIPIPANIRIVPDLGRNLPCIAVDERQIQQVFRNIIANAIDAMIDGGTLTVSTGKQLSDNAGHEFVTISFRDTGEGISPDHLGKIFEPLFSTKVKGTGLGLVACENVIHAHGGSIEVSSEVGKGSTFTVKLPAREV